MNNLVAGEDWSLVRLVLDAAAAAGSSTSGGVLQLRVRSAEAMEITRPSLHALVADAIDRVLLHSGKKGDGSSFLSASPVAKLAAIALPRTVSTCTRMMPDGHRRFASFLAVLVSRCVEDPTCPFSLSTSDPTVHRRRRMQLWRTLAVVGDLVRECAEQALVQEVKRSDVLADDVLHVVRPVLTGCVSRAVCDTWLPPLRGYLASLFLEGEMMDTDAVQRHSPQKRRDVLRRLVSGLPCYVVPVASHSIETYGDALVLRCAQIKRHRASNAADTSGVAMLVTFRCIPNEGNSSRRKGSSCLDLNSDGETSAADSDSESDLAAPNGTFETSSGRTSATRAALGERLQALLSHLRELGVTCLVTPSDVPTEWQTWLTSSEGGVDLMCVGDDVFAAAVTTTGCRPAHFAYDALMEGVEGSLLPFVGLQLLSPSGGPTRHALTVCLQLKRRSTLTPLLPPLLVTTGDRGGGTERRVLQAIRDGLSLASRDDTPWAVVDPRRLGFDIAARLDGKVDLQQQPHTRWILRVIKESLLTICSTPNHFHGDGVYRESSCTLLSSLMAAVEALGVLLRVDDVVSVGRKAKHGNM